mmetsp:Transcript_19438/g.41890  ORF Transcript_19438/g.41890 Transcript_19438/m.41890 type:complete len:266 (-) Transcript_19438:282-1079(-)
MGRGSHYTSRSESSLTTKQVLEDAHAQRRVAARARPVLQRWRRRQRGGGLQIRAAAFGFWRKRGLEGSIEHGQRHANVWPSLPTWHDGIFAHDRLVKAVNPACVRGVARRTMSRRGTMGEAAINLGIVGFDSIVDALIRASLVHHLNHSRTPRTCRRVGTRSIAIAGRSCRVPHTSGLTDSVIPPALVRACHPLIPRAARKVSKSLSEVLSTNRDRATAVLWVPIVAARTEVFSVAREIGERVHATCVAHVAASILAKAITRVQM